MSQTSSELFMFAQSGAQSMSKQLKWSAPGAALAGEARISVTMSMIFFCSLPQTVGGFGGGGGARLVGPMFNIALKCLLHYWGEWSEEYTHDEYGKCFLEQIKLFHANFIKAD